MYRAIFLTIGLVGCSGGTDGPPSQEEQKKAQDLAKDFRSQFPMPKASRARK